jgi:hypothetical protein
MAASLHIHTYIHTHPLTHPPTHSLTHSHPLPGPDAPVAHLLAYLVDQHLLGPQPLQPRSHALLHRLVHQRAVRGGVQHQAVGAQQVVDVRHQLVVLEGEVLAECLG